MKITEREVKHRDTPVAYLWQRWFIIARQPTRTYPPTTTTRSGRSRSARWSRPTSTSPRQEQQPFVPTRNGVPFPFTLTPPTAGDDLAPSRRRSSSCRPGHDDGRRSRPPRRVTPPYFPVRQIQGRGQTLAVAKPVKAGDTSIEVGHLIFDGEIDSRNVTTRPFLTESTRSSPSMRHLRPQAPAVDLVFAKPYLDGLPTGPRRQPDAQRRCSSSR